jgi:hypothetical protein
MTFVYLAIQNDFRCAKPCDIITCNNIAIPIMLWCVLDKIECLNQYYVQANVFPIPNLEYLMKALSRVPSFSIQIKNSSSEGYVAEPSHWIAQSRSIARFLPKRQVEILTFSLFLG